MSTPLPVLNRPLDNTALTAYMQCPREYYFSMYLHRRGHEGPRPPGMAYGGLQHKILESHYKGAPFELVELTATRWWERNGHDVPGDYRTLERGILDFRRYKEKWGKTPDDEIGSTVGWPDNPMVEMSADILAGELLTPYAVKIDRVIELGGLHYIEDTKYTSRLDRNFVTGFELSNQMMGYVRIAQHLMPALRISGVRLNIIHALKNTTNFERPLITYTREQLVEWEHNTNHWTRKLLADIATWPSEEELAEGAPWPVGHYGHSSGCSRKYGLCQYHSVCSVGPEFRLTQLQNFPIAVWDPLNVEEDD